MTLGGIHVLVALESLCSLQSFYLEMCKRILENMQLFVQDSLKCVISEKLILAVQILMKNISLSMQMPYNNMSCSYHKI